MPWVGEVGCSGRIITKGDNETMSKTFIEAFWTVVGSPLYGGYTFNGFLELGKLLLNLCNLVIGRIFFKLKAYNVANLRFVLILSLY